MNDTHSLFGGENSSELTTFRKRSLSPALRFLKRGSDGTSFPYWALSLFVRLHSTCKWKSFIQKKKKKIKQINQINGLCIAKEKKFKGS